MMEGKLDEEEPLRLVLTTKTQSGTGHTGTSVATPKLFLPSPASELARSIKQKKTNKRKTTE